MVQQCWRTNPWWRGLFDAEAWPSRSLVCDYRQQNPTIILKYWDCVPSLLFCFYLFVLILTFPGKKTQRKSCVKVLPIWLAETAKSKSLMSLLLVVCPLEYMIHSILVDIEVPTDEKPGHDRRAYWFAYRLAIASPWRFCQHFGYGNLNA